MSRKKGKWSWSAGGYGAVVHVYEGASGKLYGRIGNKRTCLKHTDRERAKAWARDQSERLAVGLNSAADPVPTLSKVFGIYLDTQTPQKGRSCQYQDKRAVTMFTKVFGKDKDLHKLTLGEWQEFTQARNAGALSSLGEPVAEGDRKPVGARTVENDLEWLRTVLTWATKWQDRVSGKYLMREDPSRGYPIPHEENPRRPLATDDRYDAVQAVAAQAHAMLSTILTLAHGTGRRIRAILALQRSDLLLAKGEASPYGRIRWRAEEDKIGKEWVAPISADVRAALDAFLSERLSIGAVYLFSETGERPVSYEQASKWLRKAERLAKVKKQDGSLWHAYRRGWATARKNLPAKDVAFAGGWKNAATLQGIYQQPDEDTMLRVVSEPVRLREARA